MAVDRKKLILELISKYQITTQEELRKKLAIHGVRCTQATLSRDVKALHLVKANHNGISCYSASMDPQEEGGKIARLHIAGLSILSYEAVRNMIVIATMPGLAPAVCNYVDGLKWPTMVGTIAGNDTVLLILKDNESAYELCRFIDKLLMEEHAKRKPKTQAPPNDKPRSK